MLKVQAVKMHSEITTKSDDKTMLMTERANAGNRRAIDGWQVVSTVVLNEVKPM